MRFKFLIIALLLIPSTLFAFRDSLVSLGNPYEKVLGKYTKVNAVYDIDELDTRYKWYATFHSQKFRKALLKRYEKFYPRGQDALAKKYISEMAGPEQTEFFVALYARERGLKRLAGSQNLWAVSLLVEDKEYQPVLLEELRLTPFQYQFYPYLDKWYLGYRVVFPYSVKESSGKEISLRLSSVGGVSKVTFKP